MSSRTVPARSIGICDRCKQEEPAATFKLGIRIRVEARSPYGMPIDLCDRCALLWDAFMEAGVPVSSNPVSDCGR